MSDYELAWTIVISWIVITVALQYYGGIKR